jgi:hypothetical protein
MDFRTGAAGNLNIWVGPKIGAAFPDAYPSTYFNSGMALEEFSSPSASAAWDVTQGRKIRLTALPAAAVVQLAYQMRSNVGNAYWVYRRTLRITPVKVG